MMRRALVLAAVLGAILALPMPVSAHTPSKPCSVNVTPEAGVPTDVFRITGRHFPEAEGGGSLEVQIDIYRVIFDDNGVRLRLKAIFFVTLVPDIHRFYVDYNEAFEGDRPRLRPGHYVVAAEAAHQEGCRAVTGFDVRRP